MNWRWGPGRRRGAEILDDPATPDAVRDRSMRDVVRSNRLFGGARALVAAVRPLLASMPKHAIVIDVGTGTADLPARLRRDAGRRGVTFRVVGVDLSPALLASNRGPLDDAVAADAAVLPFRGASADVVTCSQLLHHFENAPARGVVAELHRVARGVVVIADLRRSYLAAAGFWIASILLRFHPVTRHDGVISVFRGFTASELRAMIREVTGVTPSVRHRLFWRVTATWTVPGR